jgi:hypothetical protein
MQRSSRVTVAQDAQSIYTAARTTRCRTVRTQIGAERERNSVRLSLSVSFTARDNHSHEAANAKDVTTTGVSRLADQAPGACLAK